MFQKKKNFKTFGRFVKKIDVCEYNPNWLQSDQVGKSSNKHFFSIILCINQFFNQRTESTGRPS